MELVRFDTQKINNPEISGIKTVTQTVQGISYKYCKQVHRKDGYVYGF